MVNTFKLFSSWISEVEHDPETNQMTLRYSDGGATIYDGVDTATYQSVISSPSIGTAIHAFVRGNYPHRTFK